MCGFKLSDGHYMLAFCHKTSGFMSYYCGEMFRLWTKAKIFNGGKAIEKCHRELRAKK